MMKHSQLRKELRNALFQLAFAWVFILAIQLSTITFQEAAAASTLPVSTVVVEVNGPTIMGAVSLVVSFDKNLVAFEGVTASGAASGAMVVSNLPSEEGWVKVGLIKADGFSPGEVMKLTFRCVGTAIPEQKTYQVEAVTLTDLSGRAFPDASVAFSIQNSP